MFFLSHILPVLALNFCVMRYLAKRRKIHSKQETIKSRSRFPLSPPTTMTILLMVM